MINLKRKYRMSDGSLFDVTQRMLTGAFRDVAVLTNYSFTQIKLDAMDTAKIAFAMLPNDLELSAMMGEKTQEKKDKRKEATDFVMIEIMSRVELKYTTEHKIYKRFDVSDIYNERDADFFILLHRVHRQATNLFDTLEDFGLTLGHLSDLETLANEYLAAYKAQDQAIDDRDNAVETRVTAGNELYKDVAALGELGKRIWLGKSESHYNDYVIYPNNVVPPEQQVFESDVPEAQVLNVSVTDINENSMIAGENIGTTVLRGYFSALPTDLPDPTWSPEKGLVNPGGSGMGRAGDIGFLAGVREFLNIYNPGPGVGRIRIVVT